MNTIDRIKQIENRLESADKFLWNLEEGEKATHLMCLIGDAKNDLNIVEEDLSKGVLLPKQLTFENGAKSLLMGEFKEGDTSISWCTIKEIYKKIVDNQNLLNQ